MPRFRLPIRLLNLEDRNPPSDLLGSLWQDRADPLVPSSVAEPAIPQSESFLARLRPVAVLPAELTREPRQALLRQTLTFAATVIETPPTGVESFLHSSGGKVSWTPTASGNSTAVSIERKAASTAATNDTSPLVVAQPSPKANASQAVAAEPAGAVDEPAYGVELPHSQTEILVGVEGEDPLAALAGVKEIDLAASRVLLTNNGVAVIEAKLTRGADPLAAVTAVEGVDRVVWAEVNRIMAPGTGPDYTPNDPSYSSQYHLTKSQADLAWNTQTGSSGIIVAVCDNGVAINHPDLIENIYTNSQEAAGKAGVDDDGNGYIDDLHGWDAYENDALPLPSGSDDHGTFVAGVVAARTGNGIGVAGVAGGGNGKGDGVRIMPLRWEGPNGWSAADVVESFAYATDNGAKIINCSYTFDGFTSDQAVITAVDYGYGKGVLFVNSAGNSNAEDPPRKVFTQVLFVANLNSNDVRGSSSNYGAFVDISAHGTGIFSTTTNSNGTGVTYGAYSGTSASSPHAAGVAALIWSQNPTWTRDQVAARLLASADNVDSANPNYVGKLGTGRVNAFRAVTEATPPPKFGTITGIAPGLVEEIRIAAPMRFDPASVVSANFELRGDGADGAFGTADDVLIPIRINGGEPYRIGVNTLSITPVADGYLPEDRYRFTAFSGSGKLRDAFGSPLDGNGNGVGGDSFVRTFNTAPNIVGRTFEDYAGLGFDDAAFPSVAGRTVFADVNDNGMLDATTSGTFTNMTPMAINDLASQSSTLTVSKLGSTITDVNVTVNLSHTYVGDLRLELLAPDGTMIPLSVNHGGAGQNFVNTVFDDEASTPLTSAIPPFTGSFRPETPLANLDGINPNGTWTLTIRDTAGGDVGTLQNWSLAIAAGSEPSAISLANGRYAIYGVAAGMQMVRQIAPAGWTAGIAVASVTIPANGNAGQDFGSTKNNRYYGSVYHDYKLNGLRDWLDDPAPGQLVYVDSNNNGSFDGAINFTIANTNAMTISDNKVQTSTSSITGAPPTVFDIDVTVNIQQQLISDLELTLVAPNGTRVMLANNNGGIKSNFTNTRFDDEAYGSLYTSSAPYTGRFKPVGSLSAIDGSNPNGTWGLEVRDNVSGGATGTLLNWTVHVLAGTGNEPNATTDENGYFRFDLPAGTHTVRAFQFPGQTFSSPSDGSYTVTAAGLPLAGKSVGLGVGTSPQALAAWMPNGQRSRVTTATVEFNTPVLLHDDGSSNSGFEFRVTPAGGGSPIVIYPEVAWSAGNTIATLTVPATAGDFGSLPDGNFSIAVNAYRFRDSGGYFNTADQNFTNAGFFRLFGDVDGNRTVDGGTDFAEFGSVFGKTISNSPFDFDNNGTIDGSTDFAQFGARFGRTL